MPAQNPDREEQLIGLNGQTIKLPTPLAIIVDGNFYGFVAGAVFAMLYAIIMNRRILSKAAERIIR